jgi:hypothetical protein
VETRAANGNPIVVQLSHMSGTRISELARSLHYEITARNQRLVVLMPAGAYTVDSIWRRRVLGLRGIIITAASPGDPAIESVDATSASGGGVRVNMSIPPEPSPLASLYRRRCSQLDLETKRAMWQVLAERVIQLYAPLDGSVVDPGVGSCELVNSLVAAPRALDKNPETRKLAASGVDVLLTSSTDLSSLNDASVEAVLISNFFDHLAKDALLATLRETHPILKLGDRIVVLMPALRYLSESYWRYFDHHLPLTQISLPERLELTDFKLRRMVPRFVSYIIRDLPTRISPLLMRAYLALLADWRILIRQMLVVVGARSGLTCGFSEVKFGV